MPGDRRRGSSILGCQNESPISSVNERGSGNCSFCSWQPMQRVSTVSAKALAATYAIASGAPAEWAILRGGFLSYRQFFERPESPDASYHLEAADVRERRKAAFDREIPHLYFPFRALEQTDWPALMTAAPARVILIDPLNGDWKPASPAEVTTALRPL